MIQKLQLEQESLSRQLESCLEFQAEQMTRITSLESKNVNLNLEIANLKHNQHKNKLINRSNSYWTTIRNINKKTNFVEYFTQFANKTAAKSIKQQFVSHSIWSPTEPFISYAIMK